jgi:ATP-dependent RNA helicase RhlE
VSFDTFNLIPELQRAVHDAGYTVPTPIQVRAIPIVFDGRDLLAAAQTGTGKTAAFALPILQRLHAAQPLPRGPRAPRALVLVPTRELAAQVAESFKDLGRHLRQRGVLVFGGVSPKPQVKALAEGVDIIVATPGRLLDHLQMRLVDLSRIEVLVLDEADRMLDMGFVHDVKRIIAKLPQKRQTLFFSATMPPEIQRLAATILVNPQKVEVTPESTTAETVTQFLYFVDRKDKRSLLLHILNSPSIPTALVFTRTKHGADKVAQGLNRAGVRAEAIHGNKSQNARQSALLNFKNRRTRVLVATDIAARGIDIEELTHVINYELPNVPETYIHRIGRTGRAGASGIALSFCDAEEKEYLRDIQKLITRPIPIAEDNPFAMPSHQAVAARREAGTAVRQSPPILSKSMSGDQRRNGAGNQGRNNPGNQRRVPVNNERPDRVQRSSPEAPVQKMPVRRPPQQSEVRPAMPRRLSEQQPADDQISVLGLALRQIPGEEKW